MPDTMLQNTLLETMICQAYRLLVEEKGSEWVFLSALGLHLRRLYPAYQATYGGQKLADVVGQFPDLFEVRQRAIGNGTAGEMRLRQPDREAI